jgi:hypothetical protein
MSPEQRDRAYTGKRCRFCGKPYLAHSHRDDIQADGNGCGGLRHYFEPEPPPDKAKPEPGITLAVGFNYLRVPLEKVAVQVSEGEVGFAFVVPNSTAAAQVVAALIEAGATAPEKGGG